MLLRICVSTEQESEIGEVVYGYDADLFVFPECALTGYDENSGVTLKEIETYGKDVFAGAVIKAGDKLYNEYLLISEKNDVFEYKKTHLGEKEKKIYSPGDELSVMRVNGVNFGTAICIESHMPDISKALCDMGAEVLLFPFATPIACGSRKEIWNKYIPARAYDNGAFVIATNLYGGIMAVSPTGEIIAENYDSSVLLLEIDTDDVKKRRENPKVNYRGKLRSEILTKVKRYGF